MIKNEICPLCGSSTCVVEENADIDNYRIQCQTHSVDFWLSRILYEDFKTEPLFSRLMNLLAEKIIRQKKAPNNASWVFFYDPRENGVPANPAYYNLAPLLLNYPRTFMECADRSLLNLSVKYPHYGEAILPATIEARLFFPTTTECSEGPMDIQAREMFYILVDLGFINKSTGHYMISAEGWKHIEELTKKHTETKQGFIAMSFREETSGIRESIKKAINAAGFVPMIMDEKEHNHQIVPEMLREIEKSRFLVLDVTYPNYGAYYEAGYAQALGKEVIICCSKNYQTDSQYERPHFDIAQASMIQWETEEELVERLATRIIATVGQ